MDTMHNPPHPGETLLEDVLPALGLTVTEGRRAAWCGPRGAVPRAQRPGCNLAGDGLAP
jgi:hypothetical protein